MATPVIRTPYDGLPSADKGVACTKKEGKTIQSHKEYCDIEKQISQLAPGALPGSNAKAPVYGDISNAPTSILEAHERMRQYELDFAQHAPNVRLRFNNKPAEMVAFLMDPANLEESYKLGLRKKPEVTVVPPDPKVELKKAIREVMAEGQVTDGDSAS